MSGLGRAVFGSGNATQSQNWAAGPATGNENELYRINLELARRQLAGIDQLQPFQKALMKQVMGEFRGARRDRRRDARTDRMADRLLRQQYEQMLQGPGATDEQIADIGAATDAAIESGSYDIDRATQQGIGLIADEVANSRGLRLTDSPIMREAGMLADEGAERKLSLTNTLRSNQANARLNYPLAVQGLNLQTADFVEGLKQRAFMNRQALTGTASGINLGTAGISGFGSPMMSVLGGLRGGQSSGHSYNPAALMGGHSQLLGSLTGGIGGAMMSDRRVKKDYGTVGKTRDGIPVHAYRYKWDSDEDPLKLGVMADEAEKVRPDAVATLADGIKLVDYSRL